MDMQITKLNSAGNEVWYMARQAMSPNKTSTLKDSIITNTAVGYGTTPENAIADCLQNIKKLKKIASLSEK